MLREYWTRIYSPENLLITAAGNLNHDRLVDLARAQFESLPKSGTLAPEMKPEAHSRLVFKNRPHWNKPIYTWACRHMRSPTRRVSPATF